MKRRLVIGMDFGTDSVRAILADTSNGEEIASAASNYPRWAKGLYTEASKDQFRHHPLDYLGGDDCKAMTEVMASCEDPSQVEAISVDTTASTPCLGR
jgi:L-ribulokinase